MLEYIGRDRDRKRHSARIVTNDGSDCVGERVLTEKFMPNRICLETCWGRNVNAALNILHVAKAELKGETKSFHFNSKPKTQ